LMGVASGWQETALPIRVGVNDVAIALQSELY